MKYIVLALIILTSTGCIMSGRDIYIPKGNKTESENDLSILIPRMRTRDLNIDGVSIIKRMDGVSIKRMANLHRGKIFLLPGTHTLSAKVRVGNKSKLYYALLSSNWRVEKSTWLNSSGLLVSITFILCRSAGGRCVRRRVSTLKLHDWEWAPISITFTTEAGKTYLLSDFLGKLCKKPAICS